MWMPPQFCREPVAAHPWHGDVKHKRLRLKGLEDVQRCPRVETALRVVPPQAAEKTEADRRISIVADDRCSRPALVDPGGSKPAAADGGG
jgi:hypothetical protein